LNDLERIFMARDSKVWRCGKYELKFDRPRIMGVLNVTPDSFSDGGEHLDTDAAIAHGLKMLDDGADIIDVGGESTRPGFTPVDPDTEAQRVLPVVKALARAGAIVSIDTRHVEVAKAAVRVGASIVNDVTGFTDPRMVDFVKESDCGVIIMHAGEVSDIERPRTHTAVQLDTSAAAFMAEKAREAEAAARALGATGKSKRAAKAKLISNMIQPLQPQLPFDAVAPASVATDAPEVDPVTGTAVTTFDLRLTAPNKEPVMNTAECHTIEHLGATFLRNHAEWSSRVVYFGPMGCRTGFYLVVFGEVASAEILPLVRELFGFVAEFEGEIPGAAPEECGNYLDQNLPMAKWLARRYLERDLADIDEKHLNYQG
jgi:S-ribosylhomocysteine lyase LuxS involved in autoinducer biosynthesis